MMNQPVVIGVTPLYDTEKDSLWMVPGYLDGIMQAGAVPIVLPLTHGIKLLKAVSLNMWSQEIWISVALLIVFAVVGCILSVVSFKWD